MDRHSGTDKKIRDGDGRMDEQEVRDWKQMEASLTDGEKTGRAEKIFAEFAGGDEEFGRGV